MNKVIATLSILSICLLSACGFQLRGTGQTLSGDLGDLYLAGLSPNSEFALTLTNRLSDQGVRVVRDAASASNILRMSDPTSSSRLISVNRLAQGVDYSLFMRSKISLVSSEGEVLIKERQIQVRQDLVADPDDALGNDQLEQETKLELENALINAVLLQLRAR